MNIQSFLSSATSTIGSSRPERIPADANTERRQRQSIENDTPIRNVRNSEFLPADISDLEFKAQQQAEQREKRQQNSKESEAFLQTQELQPDNSRGQFIDIQAW